MGYIQILGCYSASMTLNKYQSSQVLFHKNQTYLIDCGEATQALINKHQIKLSSINNIFISHLHGDHYFGLPGLITTMNRKGRTKPLNLFGVKVDSKNGMMPLYIKGSNFLRPINFIEDKGSAQIKTCIILSAINTRGTTNLKAKKSRNHTELFLKYLNYPIEIKKNKNFGQIKIEGLNQFNSFEYTVPGDISSASFFIVLTLLSKKSVLLIKNININPSRTGVLKILNLMNAKIKILNKKNYKGEDVGDISIKSRNSFNSINCDPNLNSAAIDEFLLIFLIAAKARGISKFKNLGELNKKESRRLDISVKFLKMLGVKVLRKKDDIKIYGNPNLKLSKDYYMKNFLKDHRVFMMSVITALTLGGKWKINDKESIKTSFPEFLKITKELGAKIQ